MPHFSSVSDATQQDFERVFGRDDGKNHFQIGQPIDMDVPVCLDLRRFVERSNGIFGKSGTGKSFLTRLILCGVIKAQAAGFDATTVIKRSDFGVTKYLPAVSDEIPVRITLDAKQAQAK